MPRPAKSKSSMPASPVARISAWPGHGGEYPHRPVRRDPHHLAGGDHADDRAAAGLRGDTLGDLARGPVEVGEDAHVAEAVAAVWSECAGAAVTTASRAVRPSVAVRRSPAGVS